MVSAVFENVRLVGVMAALPSTASTLADATSRYGVEEAERLSKATGIAERRIVPAGVTTADLMCAAAEELLNRLQWPRESIGGLIAVTQTPDYALPGNAVLLQHRLGLGKDCMAYDINQGCAGYIHGCWQVATAIAAGVERVLLLVGDTTSRLVDLEDRATAPLFGDAVAATAFERQRAVPPLAITLHSDGAGAPYLIAPGHGQRDASDSLSTRADEWLFMDGTQVFVFTLREVPGNVQETLGLLDWTPGTVDVFVPHQANRMMMERLAGKVGIPIDKVVIDLERHGNTSSASIPLAIANNLGKRLAADDMRALLTGFGAGWAWGSAALCLGPLLVCDTLDLP